MAYDPSRPESIFEPGGMESYFTGIQNAYRLKHEIPGGDPFREDVGQSMVALEDAEASLAGLVKP